MSPLLLSLIVGILFLIVILNLFADEKKLDSGMARRLSEIKNSTYDLTDGQKADNKIKSNIKVLIQDTEYKIGLLGTILDRIEVTEKIRKMLKIADIKLTVDIFLIFSAISPSVCLLLGMLFPVNFFIFFVLGLILFSFPFMLVKIKIKKKLELFTQQFPDALGLVSSSLRAGHSLISSFQMVVHEMPEPICNIFKTVIDEISLGKDTRDALESMDQYLPGSLDLKFFVTAVLIQREIGGNLAEILDSLNYTIRERFKLIGQLKSQTAQSKMSGMVLGLAPIVLGLIIGLINPNYLKPLYESITGQLLLGFAIIWATIGFIIIKQITNIRV
ncbi:MAG: type II secretion system F family protein [Candidatus Gastranaerophilales bacterium]|nr:type II secretion system F family protein [Candidatus Gastranaerophilales bacterium]